VRAYPSAQGVAVYFRDVTARKRGEAALQSSEARFRTMLQGVEAGVIVHAADSKISAFNAKATELLGVSAEQMTARAADDALWGRVRADGSRLTEAELPYQRARASRLPVRGVILGVDHPQSGGRRWLLVSANPVLSPDGEVDEVIVTFMDATAQILAERAVSDNATFTTDVLNSLMAHVVVLDESGTILAVNESWRRFARENGGDADSFLGDSYLAACEKRVRPADAADARAAAAGIRFILEGSQSNFTLEYPCDSPSVSRWFRMTVAPLTGRRGAVISHHDMSARREAESALRESEAKFRTLAEAMPHLVWVASPDGKNVYCNQQWIDYTGLPLQASLGDGWGEALHPDDRASAEAEWQRAITTGTPYVLESRLRRADGVYRWWLVRATALLDGGRVDRWFGSCTDIHELKLAEIEISNSQQRFERIFQSSLVAIGIAEVSSGRLVDVNERHAEFFGYTREEMIGRTVFELGLWADPEERARQLAQVAASGAASRVEAAVRRKSGEIRHALVSLETLTLPGFAEPLTLVALLDVTERRLLEEELRQAQKMEAVGRLAGGVAHDFNNALGVILGYTELLLRHAADGQRAKLEQILKATNHAASLTRQLLAFSRKQVVQPKVLGLNAVLLDLEQMLGRVIGEDVDLALFPGADLGHVLADSGQIEQIVMNLCTNARDAMPDGGLLSITTANTDVSDRQVEHGAIPEGRYVTLKVSDTGTGMDEATLARLFEPFFTTKEIGKGTGLGLATTYGIVKQAGGYISAKSELGRGSTFTIHLPRVQEEPMLPAALPPGASTFCRETILVVEDEAPLRAIAREILAVEGYRVLEAANAAEAMSLAGGHLGRIHLLLTDVVMPGANGRVLAEGLAESRVDLRVLYMSGYTDDVIGHHGVLESGRRLIQKPFTARALLDSVRSALDQDTGGTA
jgi:PAS domain S-box-containing protein